MCDAVKSLHLPQYNASIRWHEVGGPGPVVVFLPGMGFPSKANFMDVATHRDMRDNRCVLVDFIGTGVSDAVQDFPANVDAHADCIAAIMDHLQCGASPVVGYSFGGAVAASLAIRRPDLVSRVIIAEGNLTPGGGPASRRLASFTGDEFVETGYGQMMNNLRAGDDDFAGFILKAYNSIDPKSLHALARALVDIPQDFMAQFLALDMPRAYVFGENNDPRITHKITPDIPDPSLLTKAGVLIDTVPGVGHEMMLGNLQGFVDVVRRAL